ncbi:RNA-binding protein 44 [Hyla sarda]|uniref:RNA-binding protein 44 n=1 Tax=Hyla sarda TaxID=327740 RepID=UPI0024C22EB5|nr:RNA-binding protein 44 [Hyla sarda]
MLLADEDRRLIKEYGHISEYIKKNTSLLLVNNWVRLKSESTEILERSSEIYCSSMENSRRLKDNYNPSYSLDYCDRMLQSSRPADMNPQSDTFWLEGDNDSKKEDLDPGNKSLSACNVISLQVEKKGTAKVGEPAKSFDSENIKHSLTPVLPLDLQNHQETAQDFAYFRSRFPSLTKESFAKKQYVNDSKEVNIESSECDFSCHMKLKMGNNCMHHKFALFKDYENFQESDIVAPDERSSPMPWCKYFSDVADNPVDPDCTSVDVLEDETFFSVKSGSFYSRSSSPLTLDDSTDVEQCDFEEALEDISSFSLYKQSPNSQIVPYADVQSPVWDSFLDIKNTKCTANEQKGFVEKKTIYSKSKQRNVLCNTDLSLVSVSYNDKETQTKTRSTQDTGVNTDPFGLFSQIQATTPGVGITNDVQESKGGCSSLSPEALLQRAVKAELQLVDVQRWLCWQMCWKTQQQTLEKQYYFNLNKDPSKQSEPLKSFSLSSALAEVEEKYQEMRTKIQSGTPLDTLVPLSMQLTTVDTSTDYLLKDACQPSERQNVPDVPAKDLKGTDCRKNDLEASFKFCLDKYEQKPNEEHPTENLSEPSRYYVHVGNVASCVKEAELMDVFQKYHVLSVFLEESSLSCSYAVLIFCKSDEAGAAIKEMDGKMLHGKKLKVRAIKTSSHNLPLAFQKIKSVYGDITQDEKGRFHTVEPKESFVTEPPKNVFTLSSQVQHGPTLAASVGGNLKNYSVNMPSNKFCPPVNTNQGFPVAPYCSVSGFSNFMAPGYQWMCQSQHSNMLPYSSMPNLMYVPFSYPLYKLPTHPPFQSSVTNSNNCIPSNNMKSNVNTQLFKEDSNSVRGKHTKSTHSTDRQRNFGILRSTVQKQFTSLTDKTKVLERDTGTKLMENKPAPDKSVNEQTSFTTTSNGKLHCSATSSPDSSLKMSVSVTTAGIHGAGMTDTGCLSSAYTPENISDPSNLRSTAPLRFPICVPPSVTIPEASRPSLNLNSSTGVLTPSPQQADVSSSVILQQGDSLSAGNLSLLMKQPSTTSSQYGSQVPCKPQDWGVYPKLDPSSELPVVIIPNQLNFSQFKRVVKYLMEHHKDATREQIVGTLDEIRRNRGGTFGGWTIPEIIFAVSSKLVGDTPPT